MLQITLLLVRLHAMLYLHRIVLTSLMLDSHDISEIKRPRREEVDL